MIKRRGCILALAGALFANGVWAGGEALEAGLDSARQGDYASAARSLEPLARDGSAQAQFNLALMYHSGMGVGRDEAKAVQLYHAAAEQGYTPAQEYLAAGYAEGWFGLGKDTAKARDWAMRAGGEPQ